MYSLIALAPLLFAAKGLTQSTGSGSCTDVHIFLVKGWNEQYPGRQGALQEAICADLSDQSCDYEDVQYYNLEGSDYCPAIQEGDSAGKQAITNYAARCPDSTLVVSGYSQGAHVVGDILAGGGGTYDGACASFAPLDTSSDASCNIGAALLFGDPRHVADQSYDVLDGSVGTGESPRTPAQISRLNYYADRLRSWCQIDDPACALNSGSNSIDAHTNYFDLYTNDAASWAAGKVRDAMSSPACASSSSSMSSSATSTSSMEVSKSSSAKSTSSTEAPSMSESTMSGSTMSGSTMSDSTMSDSTMSDSTMSDSTMSDSTMSDSTISDSTMSTSEAMTTGMSASSTMPASASATMMTATSEKPSASTMADSSTDMMMATDSSAPMMSSAAVTSSSYPATSSSTSAPAMTIIGGKSASIGYTTSTTTTSWGTNGPFTKPFPVETTYATTTSYLGVSNGTATFTGAIGSGTGAASGTGAGSQSTASLQPYIGAASRSRSASAVAHLAGLVGLAAFALF
ncbi:hypothetical protein B0A50_07543 [Salinomyces thailandicus]|uniref:Cutinase n=1 Tax=Salinomyces thailandicus TaxID=706561 RepID=A0A4U0TNK6_9PEZI|nr:hypothetical protein B0A50_07543 [Salinomyces thailandica]